MKSKKALGNKINIKHFSIGGRLSGVRQLLGQLAQRGRDVIL